MFLVIYGYFNFLCISEGLEEPCKKKDLGDGVYSFEYYPTTPGNYIITITWGGQHIPRRLECDVFIIVPVLRWQKQDVLNEVMFFPVCPPASVHLRLK